MLSSTSSTRLKIVGTAGHSPESLREAVDRGGKFVIYSYNFSLVVMSFKRPSDVYFIPPGQNAIIKGLPFTLISLVFGWWGIPWGIVYTCQSLYQNLSGGIDVTHDVLATIAPRPAVGPAQSAATLVQPPDQRPVSPLRLAYVAGVVVALAAIVYSGICAYMGQTFRVALVSGLDKPYTVELNGTKHQLSAKSPILLSLAEGDFTLTNAPGLAGPQHFVAQTDFFSRPFDRHVLIINPDRLAVVYRETTYYHPTTETAAPTDTNPVELLVNHPWYHVPATDFFFEDFPTNLSMPSGTTRMSKTRLTVATGMSVQVAAATISEKNGYEALRDYLRAYAVVQPNSDLLQRVIYNLLKPADARPLLESHLADRPVLVEWHRAYQSFMGQKFGDVDLVPIYQKWSEAEPENGNLLYLYARLLVDRTRSHPLYDRALHLKSPSPYAAYALAVDAFSETRYADALDLLKQAEQGGMVSESLPMRKRDALMALGRVDDVLADVAKSRARDRNDSELFVDELMLTQFRQPDRIAGQRAIAAYLTELRRHFGDGDYKKIEAYLNAHLAYALGEEQEASLFTAKLEGTGNVFESAIDRRDHKAAASAVGKDESVPVYCAWLLMITAHAAGDTAATEAYFKQAMTTLEKTDPQSRALAGHIKAAEAADHAEILRVLDYGYESRVLFTALGIHFPEQREMYFARAQALDRDPAFPHLLLRSVREKTTLSAKL